MFAGEVCDVRVVIVTVVLSRCNVSKVSVQGQGQGQRQGQVQGQE